MKRFYYFIAAFLMLMYFELYANDISGEINKYSKVTSVNKGSNYVETEHPEYFGFCDLVLLIQMRGASINLSNSAEFGSIVDNNDYRSAGNYEFLVISKIDGNKIFFSTEIKRTYEITGKVQLIRVPFFENATVTDTLRPKKWDGTTGGVLALKVDNTLTLNKPIKASGCGFEGAVRFGDATNTIDQPNYYYPYPSWEAALKGDGIYTELPSSRKSGRGAPANGGGGGNNHNAGGGGGSNAGSGGKGGLCWNKRMNQSTANDYGGLGGWALDYNATLNKIFMGGGGGAGHSNASDNVSTKGEDGGGIIIIIAKTIIGNSQYIMSNGLSAVVGGNDGSGGGGGAGTVILNVDNYQGVLSIYAQGGNGGDNDGSQKENDLVGPGGGGGGGFIWHKNASLPSGVSPSVRYGFNGLITNNYVTVEYQENYGAQAGSVGEILNNLTLFIPNMLDIDDIDLNPGNNGPLCPQETLELYSGLPDSLKQIDVEWKGPNGFKSTETEPKIENVSKADSGWYYISVVVCGATIIDSTFVKIIGSEVKIIPADAVLCENDTLILRTKGKFSSYKWSTGATSDTIIVTKAGNYSVTAIDSNGCKTEDIVSIAMVEAPKPKILPENPKICFGDTVHIWTEKEYPGYRWSSGDTTREIVANKGGRYTVTVIDSNGCKGSAEIFIQLLPNPVPDIMPKEPKICSNGSSIDIYLVKDYKSIKWFNGQTSKTVTVSTPGLYTVTVTDSNGCVGTGSIRVDVVKAPEPYIVPVNPTICKLDSVLLQTEKKYISYLWSTGDSASFIIVKALGKYSVTVVDENGCNGKADIEVKEFKLAPEIIGGNVICIKDSAVLETFDKYKTYKWSTGETTPTITVYEDGIYELEVEDEKGCAGKAKVRVHIGEPPQPKIEFIGNQPFCPGDDVWLQTTETYATYKWSGGQSTRKIRPTQGGSYMVTVIDTNGCTGIATIDIEMYPQPKPGIDIIGKNPFCANDSVILVSIGEFVEYRWSTGDTTKQVVVNEAKIYTLTVTDSNGCKGTAQIILRHKDLGAKIDIVGAYPICEGDSIILRPNKEFSNYLWSTGDTTKQIVVRENGRFWLWVMDKDGCSGYSDTVNIQFDKSPDPFINGPVMICKNALAVYSVMIEDRPTMTYWKVSGGKLIGKDSEDSIIVKWGETNHGRVTVSRRYNDTPCISYDTLEVEILENLKPGIFASSLTVCEGGSATISTEKGYDSYEWSTGGKDSYIEIDKAGKYWVHVSAADGCDGVSDTLEIVLAPGAFPVISQNGILCKGDSALLTVTGSFASYDWSNGMSGKSIYVRQAGEYVVTVQNADGCLGRDTITVEKFNSKVSIDPESVDFGEILLGTESGSPIELINESENAITLSKIFLKNQASVFIIKNQNSLPKTMYPNERISLSVVFSPIKPGKYSDSLIVEINSPCPARIAVYIGGIGFAKTLVWLPEIKARVGEADVCLPIMGKYNFDYDESLRLSYETDIKFLKTLFYPTNYQTCILDKRLTDDKDLILSLNGINITFGAGENLLGSICGSVLLGDEYSSPLHFNRFRWVEPYVYVELIDGKLETGGVCMPDLSRISHLSPTELNLTPNPVKERLEVEISSQETGSFQLFAYNLSGVKVHSYEFENDKDQPFVHKVIFDMRKNANGLYFVVLRSPWNVWGKQFILLKE